MKKLLPLIFSLVMLWSLCLLSFAASTTDEAKWGASKSSLTESGTLAQAFAAAQSDSSIEYIQIQKDMTMSEDGYMIQSGTFTLDLNGKTVTGNNKTIYLRDYYADVTFTDSASGGKIVSTGKGVPAINVYQGCVTVTGGTYQGDYGLWAEAGAVVTLKNGTFIGTYYGVLCSGAPTIENGSYSGGYAAVMFSGATVTGGTFTAGKYGHFDYYGWQLDLSGYKGTLAGLTIYNNEDDLIIDNSTIELPSGYGLSSDGKTVVSVLEKDVIYTVISTTSTPEVPTEEIQAKWGASAAEDDLTKSGLLEQAFKDAKADSSIKYIKLQKDITRSDSYEIEGGTFTLDLNGKTVTATDDYGFFIQNEGTHVTFTDTSAGKGGKVVAQSTGVVAGANAKASINAGTYEGLYGFGVKGEGIVTGGTILGSVTGINSDGGTVTISGGSISAVGDDASAAVKSHGTTIIKGGTFTCDSSTLHYYSIYHYEGKLDLSQYPTQATTGTTPLTDLTFGTYQSLLDVDRGDDFGNRIILPSGYGFSKDGTTIVTQLYDIGSYSVIAIPEALWGASADNLTGSGTLDEALAAAKANSDIKYIQIQKDLTETDCHNITGGTFTLDLNGKTVTAYSKAFYIASASGEVTFTDSAKGGKIVSTEDTAVLVSCGSVRITGGSYEGAMYGLSLNGYPIDANNPEITTESDVTIDAGSFTARYAAICNSNGGSLTVNGGTFTTTEGYDVMATWGAVSTTVVGGTFSSTLSYTSGTYDLSDYKGTTPLNDLTVMVLGEEDKTVGTDIKLPEGYVFSKDGSTAVTKLEVDTFYFIIPKPVLTVPVTVGDVIYLQNGTVATATASGDYEIPDTDGYVTVNTGYTAQKLYKVSDNNVTEVAALRDGVFGTNEASIRNDAVASGLRFKSSFLTALRNTVKEYGYLVTVESVYNALPDGYKLDMSLVTAGKAKKGVAFAVDESGNSTTDISFDTDGSRTIVTAVATGIPMTASGVNTLIAARPYYILENGTVVYGEITSYTVGEVAESIKNANGAAYEGNKDYIDQIVGLIGE